MNVKGNDDFEPIPSVIQAGYAQGYKMIYEEEKKKREDAEAKLKETEAKLENALKYIELCKAQIDSYQRRPS